MGDETAVVRIRTEEDRVAVVDRARAMLERARSPVEAKHVHDLAKAAETYARLQKLGEEAVRHAQGIAVDAMALMGEMLKQVRKSAGGRPSETPSREEGVSESPPTLAQQGITHKQSMVAQSLATAKEERPELYDQVRAGQVSVTAAHVAVKRRQRKERAAEPEPVVSAPAAPVDATIRAVPDSRPAAPVVDPKPTVESDPDHPFARSLKAMTALVRAINADMGEDESGMLRANLNEFAKMRAPLRMVLYLSGKVLNGAVTLPRSRFVGLAHLRAVVRDTGKRKKRMTPKQLNDLIERINTIDEGTLIEKEGDES